MVSFSFLSFFYNYFLWFSSGLWTNQGNFFEQRGVGDFVKVYQEDSLTFGLLTTPFVGHLSFQFLGPKQSSIICVADFVSEFFIFFHFTD